MSNLYQSRNKCYLIDHHSPQPPVIPLDHLCIDEYERFIETADVDSMIVYCKDHWGVTYFDSNVEGAQKHEGVKGDWIAQVRTLLKKKNVEFVAYYCIEYDEGAARRHPDWRAMKSDGTPLIRDDAYAKWSICCYQSDYRYYCLEQLKEIITNYSPDALFLDIFGSSLCYCENCRKKFIELYGYPLPESRDAINMHTLDILEFLDNNAKEFYQEIKDSLKRVDSSLAITVNFSCHYPQDFRVLLDYQFSEPLLGDNWFSSAYARDTAIGQYPILAPGEASQVYNYNHVNQYIYDLSSIAAQGCRVGMYSGSQHRDGTLDFEEANRLGTAYRILDKMSPWLIDRIPYANVGIIQSDASKNINLPDLVPDAILRMKHHCPHTDAVLGAMNLCENAKLPWKILPDRNLTLASLKNIGILLLPEVYIINNDLAGLLREYTASGGKIVASMETGMWNADGTKRKCSILSDILGVVYQNTHREYKQNTWSAYLRPLDPEQFHGLLSCTTPPVSDLFAEIKPTTAASLAEFILPCVACDSKHWVNWWSPPPGDDTEFPALTVNNYSKGTAVYLAFDYFNMAKSNDYQDTDALFKDILDLIDFRPKLYNIVSSPHMIRTAFFRRADSYIVHQLSTLPKFFKGETTLVSGGALILQEKIRSARLVYPIEQELSWNYDKHKKSTTIPLPQFTIQQILYIQR